MKNLGEAFDYAKNSYKIDMDSFMDMFITSGYAKLFQDGNTKVIEGISGCELVLNIFEKIGLEEEIIMPSNSFFINHVNIGVGGFLLIFNGKLVYLLNLFIKTYQ